MAAISYLVNAVLSLAWWLIIIAVVFSWLIAFNVVNMRNGFVAQVGNFLYTMTEPMMRPVRRVIPPIGGTIDIAPIVVLIGITFLQILWNGTIFPALVGATY